MAHLRRREVDLRPQSTRVVTRNGGTGRDVGLDIDAGAALSICAGKKGSGSGSRGREPHGWRRAEREEGSAVTQDYGGAAMKPL